MKKNSLTLLVFIFCHIVLYAQNVPDLSATILPPSADVVTMQDFSSSGQYNFQRVFIPNFPTSNSGLISDYHFFDGYTNVSTTYLGGFGTTIEAIKRSGSPSTKDIIAFSDNRFSKTSVGYLPFESTAGSYFQSTPFESQQSYYLFNFPDEGTWAFSKTVVTPGEGNISSTSSYSSGGSFVGSGNGLTVSTNINDGTEQIIVFGVNDDGTIAATGDYYGAGQLTIKTSQGPHNFFVQEFYDKSNEEICKKVFSAGEFSTAEQIQITYFIYNDLGKLVQTITPQGIDAFPFVSSTTTLTSTIPVDLVNTTNSFNKFGSPIAITKPGQHGQSNYTVYDTKNRPVLVQTPLMKSETPFTEYMFFIYDTRDRLVMRGFYKETDPTHDYQYWQNQLNTATVGSSGTLLYYWLNVNPFDYPTAIAGCEIETVNFYDVYPFSNPVNFDASYASDFLDPSVNSAYVTPVPYMFTHGMLTASMSRIHEGHLIGGVLDPYWTCSTNFYDQQGRTIQVRTLNQSQGATYNDCISGGVGYMWDQNSIQYSFSGAKLMEISTFNDATAGSNKPFTKIINTYNVDFANNCRVKSEYQQIDGGTNTLIASYAYDNLGRVSQKSLGDVEIQHYDYNMNSRLTGINRAYALDPTSTPQSTYGSIISYDVGFTEPRYDGQISGYVWRGASHTSSLRAYGYEYDGAKRLTNGNFNELCDPVSGLVTGTSGDVWNNNFKDYSANNIFYDKNGNLLSMNQMGTSFSWGVGFFPVPIDQLSYQYFPGTNQLQDVADGISYSTGFGDFTDGNVAWTTGVDDYAYDPDGNISQDLNKNVSSIAYNESDQPLTVTEVNGSTINNYYTGDGQLWKKIIVNTSTGVTDEYRYWGDYTFKNNELQYILHDEGRLRYSSIFTPPMTAPVTMGIYDYFVKDHLGNVRTVVSNNLNIFGTGSGAASDGSDGPISHGSDGSITYFASHEIAAADIENMVFSRIEKVRNDKPDNTDSSDTKTATLNASYDSLITGTTILLHVMAGDRFDVGAQSFYDSSYADTGSIDPATMLSSIISTLTSGTPVAQNDKGLSDIINGVFNMDNYSVYQSLLDSLTDPTIPQAYINYMVFDENMNLVPGESGAIQIGAGGGTWQPMGTSSPITVSSTGFIAIFISTSTMGIPISFDHFTVHVMPSPLLQEQNYYPFGLSINEGESNTAIPNQFKFQGKKMQDELGLNLSDFTARNYDHQLGRFCSPDPMQQFANEYTGMGNNPANIVDPSGCWGGYNYSLPDKMTNYNNPPGVNPMAAEIPVDPFRYIVDDVPVDQAAFENALRFEDLQKNMGGCVSVGRKNGHDGYWVDATWAKGTYDQSTETFYVSEMGVTSFFHEGKLVSTNSWESSHEKVYNATTNTNISNIKNVFNSILATKFSVHRGNIVINTPFVPNNTAFTPAFFVVAGPDVGYDNPVGIDLLNHEFGHVATFYAAEAIGLETLGLPGLGAGFILYTGSISIPSAINFQLYPDTHTSFYTEQIANTFSYNIYGPFNSPTWYPHY